MPVIGANTREDEPETGELLPDLVLALSEVLARHTRAPERCLFCIWEGGWVNGSGAINVAIGRDRGRAGRSPAAVGGCVAAVVSCRGALAAALRLAGRNRGLLEGPLDSVGEIGEVRYWRGSSRFESHSPNLWWPDDRAWCVATDIDLDSRSSEAAQLWFATFWATSDSKPSS